MGLVSKFKSLFKKDEKSITDELSDEQKIIDEMYRKEGLTDEVLDKQIELNRKRHKLNIPDETKLNNDGWSQ